MNNSAHPLCCHVTRHHCCFCCQQCGVAPLPTRRSTGRLLCHWDPSWSWGQLQLVAACHGPGNTIFILTAARVVFLVSHNGGQQQQQHTSLASSADDDDDASAGDGDSQGSSAAAAGGGGGQQAQLAAQQILEKFSVKWYHSSVSAIAYDDKSGLLLVAGDGSSSGSSAAMPAASVAPGSGGGDAAAAFAAEGVSVSVWQLRERQLQLKFALGAPKVCEGAAPQGIRSPSQVCDTFLRLVPLSSTARWQHQHQHPGRCCVVALR